MMAHNLSETLTRGLKFHEPVEARSTLPAGVTANPSAESPLSGHHPQASQRVGRVNKDPTLRRGSSPRQLRVILSTLMGSLRL